MRRIYVHIGLINGLTSFEQYRTMINNKFTFSHFTVSSEKSNSKISANIISRICGITKTGCSIAKRDNIETIP